MRVIKVVITIALLFTLFSFSGCSCEHEEPYKTFTYREGLSKFSFEYPPRFDLDDTLRISSPEVDLLIHFWTEDFGLDPDTPNIYVSADSVFDGDGIFTVESMVSEYLAYITRLYTELALDSREMIMVAGVQGEKLTYTYKSPTSTSEAPDVITQVVFFQQDDIQYTISLFDRISHIKTVEKEFSHIVKSFKFLE